MPLSLRDAHPPGDHFLGKGASVERVGAVGDDHPSHMPGRQGAPHAVGAQSASKCATQTTGEAEDKDVIQGTAEKDSFSAEDYAHMVALAIEGTKTLFTLQREALSRARQP